MVWREILGWLGVLVEAEVLSSRGRSSGGCWLVVAPGRQLSMISCVLELLLENSDCEGDRDRELTTKCSPLVAVQSLR